MFRKRQKPFSQLKDGGGQKKKVLRDFASFVDCASGGDCVGLIAAYLGSNFGKSCKNWVYEVPRFKNLLKVLHSAFEKQPSYEKRQLLSVARKAGFSMVELHSLGWKFSKKAWTSAGKHNIVTYPGR